MILQWVLFALCTTFAYIGIAWFAQLSGGTSTSAWQAFFSALKPIPLLIVTIANMFFALAAYWGLSLTRFAIPAMISIGAITAFAYSVAFLSAKLTALKLLGIALTIAGIALIAL